jgi:hypothetical protein
MARQLHREGEIDHADVLAALGLTAQTAAYGLALIRAGSVSGQFRMTIPA